jgi:ligand-binding SRPBCC domain-containing protein
MTKITREVWIDAPKEQVWAVMADFGNVYRFNPTVPKSYSI